MYLEADLESTITSEASSHEVFAMYTETSDGVVLAIAGQRPWPILTGYVLWAVATLHSALEMQALEWPINRAANLPN